MNARRCMWAPGEDALHYLSLALCDRRRVRNATTFPPQKLIGPDVADGSFATKLDRPRHVRFPPVSDRTADIAGGPFRARTRHGSWQINWAEHLPNHADRLLLGLRDIFGRNRSCDRPADARR